jgi:putative hydrolase of the HAD superfamily
VIRAILLDLGKVIVPFDFSVGYRSIESRIGLSPEAIRERIRSTGLVPRFETGLIEPHDFVQQLCQALQLDITYNDFCDIWSSIFSRNTLISEEFIASLASRYPLILVSNTNHIHFEMIRQNYPLLRHFKQWVLSYKVQAMKPSPLIYHAAVAAAGCEASECFFTDDIAEYVEGARQCGIDAVPFLDQAQLALDLRARGVECE